MLNSGEFLYKTFEPNRIIVVLNFLLDLILINTV